MTLSKAKPYEINLAALSEGKHNFSFTLTDDFLDEYSRDYVSMVNSLNVNIELEKLPLLVTVLLKVKGTLEVPCSLCNKLFHIEIEKEGRILFTFEDSLKNVDADAIYYVSPANPIVNLGQDIYDYLCLALPRRFIPKECEEEICDPTVRSYLKRENPL